MKKVLCGILVTILSVITFCLAYDYRDTKSPNNYYKVYLNDEVIGVIQSKSKLEKFIDAEGESIKKKYGVDTVYAPEGLIMEELTSYNQEVSEVSKVYRTIISKADLTIEGYQISLKSGDDIKHIYVTEEDIFKTAVIDLIKTYVGSDRYKLYDTNSQAEILDTGKIIENIYVQNDITIKKMRIPVSKKIFSSASSLSKYLLYGDNANTKEYVVKVGDTISSVSLENEISTEEFLIANTSFTDKSNLLHVGETVTIAVPNPQIQVVVEEYQVVDKESAYQVEERYDDEMNIGTTKVIQEGVNGIIRVSQNVQSINGSITYIEPIDRVEVKQPISKIVLIGNHKIPHIGDLNNWAWPTMSGYTITDDFEWRTNPITGAREHHSGIDISGLGYGAPIYAANNGTIEVERYKGDYGYYILINHNNGYWTLYGHMSRFAADVDEGDIVQKGQLIGYIGSTGWATGPHLHFEVWKNCEHCRINPFSLY
nr:M23 family metallopeptidase [Bacilli bacterium]